eukprot:7545801-Karenia_brevis.AAC.1
MHASDCLASQIHTTDRAKVMNLTIVSRPCGEYLYGQVLTADCMALAPLALDPILPWETSCAFAARSLANPRWR